MQLTQQDQNPRMAVIHLLPHFDSDGNGVVYVATDLACAQSIAGLSVACVGGGNGSLVRLLEDCSVATYVIAAFKSASILKLRGLFRLWRILKVLRPEVVHAHTIPMALMAKLLQSFLGFGLVTSVHNGPRLRNFLLVVGDRIICVSAAVAEGMKRFHISEGKLRVVRNGPIGTARKRSVLPAPPKTAVKKPTIVTIASLHTYKGIQDLIAAFAIARKSVPDLSMHILGRGPARSRLKRQTARLNCNDCIHFEGFVEDPRAFLAQADVFVAPSHREAFGLALAEAREAGCAVIGTNVGGIPEVLEGGRSGILVAPKDPARLSQVLIQLFTNQELLQYWRQRAAENLLWLHVDRVSRETIEIYSEMLSPPDRGRIKRLVHDRPNRNARENPNRGGLSLTHSPLQVYVHLAYGFGAESWNRRWKQGKIIGVNEPFPYGYYHADKMGCLVTHSRDHEESAPTKFLRLATRVILGFDLIHAWRNLEEMRRADVIWTHTESQHLAILLLFQLTRRQQPRPKLIAQSVWLFDRWPKLPTIRKRLFSWLINKADILTVLSPTNLAVAKRMFPKIESELVLFGIAADVKVPPRAQTHKMDINIASLGNDEHRDWDLLIDVTAERPEWNLKIASQKVKPSSIAAMKNIEIVRLQTNCELLALYQWADVVVLAIKPNLHASGITVIEEAALQGVPVICSDAGGLGAYFRETEVRFVPPLDATALRNAIDELAGDPELRLDLARRAQARMASDDLSSESFARQHVAISRRLLASAHPAERAAGLSE
jgi:glycosyltransferase involved in cell wall biosynthesis